MPAEPARPITWKMRIRHILRPILGPTIAWLFYLVGQVLFRTYRVTVIGKENEDRFLRNGQPTLFVSWHQGLFYFIFHFRNRNGIVMTSKSADGNIIAKVLELFGFQSPPRGSSSKDGKKAMHEMIEMLRRTNCGGGLVADAPRGPFGVAKMGIVKIAQETGLPLIPVMWWPKWAYRFKSWDRTLLPLPFSRIVFYYAGPIFVPADITPEGMEKMRQDLTDQLNQMHREASRYFE